MSAPWSPATRTTTTTAAARAHVHSQPHHYDDDDHAGGATDSVPPESAQAENERPAWPVSSGERLRCGGHQRLTPQG